MAPICPNCGVESSAIAIGTCPMCGRGFPETPRQTDITSARLGAENRYADDTPAPELDDELPNVVKPAERPVLHVLLIVAGSTGLCAYWGGNSAADFPRLPAFTTMETLTGAAVGLAIGLAIAVDYWMLKQKIHALAHRLGEGPDAPGAAFEIVRRPSEWISAVMLAVPILNAIVCLDGETLGLSIFQIYLVSCGTVLSTAVLGYLNIRQMALAGPRRRADVSILFDPIFSYLGMLAFWMVWFPLHFIARGRMGGRNWVIPALIGVAAYFAPSARVYLFESELPAVNNPDVLALVRQMVEDEPMMKPVTVAHPVEVSFDAVAQKRIGRCTATSKFGAEPVLYKIDWQNRKRGLWQVQIFDRLPFAHMPEVAAHLKDVLAFEWAAFNPGPITVRNPVQLDYDPARQERTARATVSTIRGDREVTFVIIFGDAERKTFNVRVNAQPP